MAEIQVVVFGLNGEMCGADTSQVYKIEKYQNVTKVPDMPEFIDGIINLRGRIVPLVNLNTRFGLGKTEITKKSKIIITEMNKSLVGFVVNDVSEILKLTEENIEKTPEIIHRAGNAYLKSVGKKEDKLISILDLVGILTENEVERLDRVTV